MEACGRRNQLLLIFGCLFFVYLIKVIIYDGYVVQYHPSPDKWGYTVLNKINGYNYRGVSPRLMVIKYFEMWDHRTSTMNQSLYVPSNNDLRYPFYDGVPSSLEILESVLHGPNNDEEYSSVDEYIKRDRIHEGKKESNSSLNIKLSVDEETPQCLMPDRKSTSELVDEILKGEHAQITLPLLNLGFPKIGSNTLNHYFNCIGIPSNHGQKGDEMMKRTKEHQLLLRLQKNKTEISSYMQLDNNRERGFYPQIQLLDELHEEAPNSTFIINFRPINDWIRSVKKWYDMKKRFDCFDLPGLILTPEQRTAREENTKKRVRTKLTDEQLARWFCGHVKHIREYVKLYPSHRLIELDLYNSSETSKILYDIFQATSNNKSRVYQRLDGTKFHVNKKRTCWGHFNEN